MALGVPAWLETLMSLTTFFSPCEVHDQESNNECNSFCVTCNIEAQCPRCTESEHKDHRVIKVRSSTYRVVLRVTDIYKDLDIGRVQTYKINRSRVVFLHKRKEDALRSKSKSKSKSKKRKNSNRGGICQGTLYSCEICERSISYPYKFCSVGCKLAYIKENGDGKPYALSPKSEGEMRKQLLDEMSKLPSKQKRSCKRGSSSS